MEFLKFPSLLDARLMECELNYAPEVYEKEVVSTEKLHGTNFGIYVSSTGELKFSARTEFKDAESINKRGSMHKFLLELIDQKFFIELGVELCKKHDFQYVIFNGELFGYKIFKMNYSQVLNGEHEVRFFTIIGVLAVLANSVIKAKKLSYDEFSSVLPSDLIVPFEFRGKYTEAISLANLEQNSQYGGEREGYVLMPTEEIEFYSDEKYPLLALKIKGKEFQEVSARDFSELNFGKYKIRLRERFVPLAQDLYGYATKGRIENVISHSGRVYTIKDIITLTNELKEDILKEYANPYGQSEVNITETLDTITPAILYEVKTYLLT